MGRGPLRNAASHSFLPPAAAPPSPAAQPILVRHTLFTVASTRIGTSLRGATPPSQGLPSTYSHLSPSPVLAQHSRWQLKPLGWETRAPRFPFPLINLPPLQASDFVLPLGKLP